MPDPFTEAYPTSDGGVGPISYREAVGMFASKADLLAGFADLKDAIGGWRTDVTKVLDDQEKRLRAIEGRQVPYWAMVIVYPPIIAVMLHYIVPGVYPH